MRTIDHRIIKITDFFGEPKSRSLEQVLLGSEEVWENLPSTYPSLCVCLSLSLPPMDRIKQPALKHHGNKESFCKPCYMTQLASVCGTDGHTYSSVVSGVEKAHIRIRSVGVKGLAVGSGCASWLPVKSQL